MPWSTAWSRINSFPVMSGSIEASCKATPMIRRTSAADFSTSWPPILAVPPVGRSRVVSIRTVVDLPAPLGPRNPKTSPRVTARSIPSTATTSPKVRSRPLASITTSSPNRAPVFPPIRGPSYSLNPVRVPDGRRVTRSIGPLRGFKPCRSTALQVVDAYPPPATVDGPRVG